MPSGTQLSKPKSPAQMFADAFHETSQIGALPSVPTAADMEIASLRNAGYNLAADRLVKQLEGDYAAAVMATPDGAPAPVKPFNATAVIGDAKSLFTVAESDVTFSKEGGNRILMMAPDEVRTWVTRMTSGDFGEFSQDTDQAARNAATLRRSLDC